MDKRAFATSKTREKLLCSMLQIKKRLYCRDPWRYTSPRVLKQYLRHLHPTQLYTCRLDPRRPIPIVTFALQTPMIIAPNIMNIALATTVLISPLPPWLEAPLFAFAVRTAPTVPVSVPSPIAPASGVGP